jgi:cytochrome c oxidase cbb3-type subunit 2
MMNRLKFIFVGFMITFASAWIGLAIAPSVHYRASAPAAPPGEADALIEQGRKIYLRDGCIYCHSQQISARHFRSDQARGWGKRRTVASDYQNDKTGVFGTMRTGPDLANIGSRNPSPQWHYLHLYDPQITSKGSIMPPFRYLFERRKASAPPGPDAVPLGDGDEIVPTPEVRALVAYLISLKHDVGMPPEAFEPPAKQ